MFNGGTTQFNTIENNVFASTFWRMLGYGSTGSENVFNRNIVYNLRAPELFGVNDYSSFDQISESDYNLYYNFPSWNQENWDNMLSAWKGNTSFDMNSLEENPLFVDFNNDDFNLMSESNVTKDIGSGGIGFQQIDMSNVGPRVECFDDNDCFGDECIQKKCYIGLQTQSLWKGISDFFKALVGIEPEPVGISLTGQAITEVDAFEPESFSTNIIGIGNSIKDLDSIELIGFRKEVQIAAEYLLNELLGLDVSVKTLTIGYVVKDTEDKEEITIGF